MKEHHGNLYGCSVVIVDELFPIIVAESSDRFNGRPLRTSVLVRLDRRTGEVETMNSIYQIADTCRLPNGMVLHFDN